MDKLMSELEKRHKPILIWILYLVFLRSFQRINFCEQKLADQYPNDLNSRLLNEQKLYIKKGKWKPTALDLLKLIRSKNLESTFLNIDVALQIFLTMAATKSTNCSAGLWRTVSHWSYPHWKGSRVFIVQLQGIKKIIYNFQIRRTLRNQLVYLQNIYVYWIT